MPAPALSCWDFNCPQQSGQKGPLPLRWAGGSFFQEVQIREVFHPYCAAVTRAIQPLLACSWVALGKQDICQWPEGETEPRGKEMFPNQKSREKLSWQEKALVSPVQVPPRAENFQPGSQIITALRQQRYSRVTQASTTRCRLHLAAFLFPKYTRIWNL